MLGSLKPPKGARHKQKRVGRGPGSGHGKTATRGNKGSGQRAGKEYTPAFEGGQTPLYRRIPKRGFKNPFKKVYEVVNLETLDKLKMKEITPEVLRKRRIVKRKFPIKILGMGEVSSPLRILAHSFSKSAKKKIEEAGGSTEVIK